MATSALIYSGNVQNALLFRRRCFIRSHLRERSHHPVSLSTSPSSPPHPSPICTSIFLSRPTIASLSPAPSHPSYSRPARLHLSFLTSLSFLPVFQPRLFPPSFSVTPALWRPISPTFRALLSVPLCPSFFVYPLASDPRRHLSPFSSFPRLFLEYVISQTSRRHQSSISRRPRNRPDINQPALVSWYFSDPRAQSSSRTA